MSEVVDAKLLKVIIRCYSDFTDSDIKVRFSDALEKLELEAECSMETVEEWNELAYRVKFFNQPGIFYSIDMGKLLESEESGD